MAEEKKFENKIKEFLKTLPNCWFFKHWAGMYSQKGIPDIMCCINGRFVGLEVKASNGRPSPLQVRCVKLINEAGGYAVIVYPKDWEQVRNDLIEIAGGN